MFDTIPPVEVVDDLSRDLVTLLTTQPQGIDSVHQILLHLSGLETAALRVSHRGLEIFSLSQFISLYSSLTSSSPGGQMAMLVRVVWSELQTLVCPSWQGTEETLCTQIHSGEKMNLFLQMS